MHAHVTGQTLYRLAQVECSLFSLITKPGGWHIIYCRCDFCYLCCVCCVCCPWYLIEFVPHISHRKEVGEPGCHAADALWADTQHLRHLPPCRAQPESDVGAYDGYVVPPIPL